MPPDYLDDYFLRIHADPISPRHTCSLSREVNDSKGVNGLTKGLRLHATVTLPSKRCFIRPEDTNPSANLSMRFSKSTFGPGFDSPSMHGFLLGSASRTLQNRSLLEVKISVVETAMLLDSEISHSQNPISIPSDHPSPFYSLIDISCIYTTHRVICLSIILFLC